MSSSEKLLRLEAILKLEFEVLALGQFKKLGELLCEKLHLLESLGPNNLDRELLKRCSRLNKELCSSLSPYHQAKKAYPRRA